MLAAQYFSHYGTNRKQEHWDEVKQLAGPKRNRSWADGLLELEGLCAVLILHVTHYSRGLTEMHAIRVRLVLIVPGWLLPYPQILQLTRPGTQPL